MSRPVSQVFLISLTVAMACLFLLTRGNPMQETLLSVASLLLIAASLLLERVIPLKKDWNRDAGDTAGDLGSFVLVFGVVEGALKYLSPFLILAVLPQIGPALDWALWAEVLVATLVIELGAWASHYAHHRYKPLWALHAMHHSTRRLYTLNNFRFHPLNHLVNHVAMFVPLLALGISTDALLAYTAITLPVLIFQHTNVHFDFGALNQVLNTNALHRWHHSTALQEGMHNFGRALVIWDRLFGTYYNPATRHLPDAVGLSLTETGYPWASQTLRQLAWPLNPQCCR